jgi:hypothetical protein
MASLIVNQLPPKQPRRVSVEQAAAYAGISRSKMYELIELKVVVSGHRPGTNRRYVELDSVDALYQSPERLRIAEELVRNRRKKGKIAENGNGP